VLEFAHLWVRAAHAPNSDVSQHLGVVSGPAMAGCAGNTTAFDGHADPVWQVNGAGALLGAFAVLVAWARLKVPEGT
jgi:hypothetical protein